mmetsp:Transcript_100502/g.146710  ORF Transcript_100502/g.146710 Transcript_100502/m.146710 type:complete len:111 (+) Transcript_100502:686-1018(+)
MRSHRRVEGHVFCEREGAEVRLICVSEGALALRKRALRRSSSQNATNCLVNLDSEERCVASVFNPDGAEILAAAARRSSLLVGAEPSRASRSASLCFSIVAAEVATGLEI